MFSKWLVLYITLALAIVSQETTATSVELPKKFITPIDVARYQIETLIKLVNIIVTRELKTLHDIRDLITKTTENAIKAAIVEIEDVFDNTIGLARKIMQGALDKGVNITECYVMNMDELRNMRRQFIMEEIQCATSQVGELYTIIDDAASNFTDDLIKVADFPKRLQKCLLAPITIIKCVSEVIGDVSQLQKDIPAQILATMLQVTQYLTGFDQRVHQCEFDMVRKAIDGTRPIIDNLMGCARDPEHNH